MLQSDWLYIPKPITHPDLRIICFPYAGGSALSYKPWANLLANSVELIAIQPPGRGNRMFEPAISRMEDLTNRLLPFINDLVDIPYIFFGHSMGSRIAFEIMSQLSIANKPLPMHFIASGSRGPQIPNPGKAIYDLPDNELIIELAKLNGTPSEILENKELIELLLPTLRADLTLSHIYCSSSSKVFDCPISILGGTEDPEVKQADLQSWETNFSSKATIHMLPGNHFFIETHRHLVLQKVNMIIKNCLHELIF